MPAATSFSANSLPNSWADVSAPCWLPPHAVCCVGGVPDSGIFVGHTTLFAARARLVVAQAVLRVVLQVLGTGPDKEVTLAAGAEVVAVAAVLIVAISCVEAVTFVLQTWPR